MLKLHKYRFDIALAILTLLSTVLMFIASSDPVPGAIQSTDLHSLLKQFATGNQIIFDLSVGILAGVFIYYLVVRVPERGRRLRVRRNLARRCPRTC